MGLAGSLFLLAAFVFDVVTTKIGQKVLEHPTDGDDPEFRRRQDHLRQLAAETASDEDVQQPPQIADESDDDW